ncbi:MAG: hypothetical protein JXB14_07925 [Candidatus Altiarchaeota archaeon]|nr:hypothetical protein [Candidatus Altiarchaeota archaeon]
MVKAQKRKPGRQVPEPGKKVVKRREQLLFLGILVLIVSGFTLTGLLGPTYNQDQNPLQDNRQTVGYIQATFTGNKQVLVTEARDTYAVLGEPRDTLALKNILGGDLILIGEGATALMVTNATRDQLDKERAENSILYQVGLCQSDVDITCFFEPDSPMNQTEYFEEYVLDNRTTYLETGIIAFPLPDYNPNPASDTNSVSLF